MVGENQKRLEELKMMSKKFRIKNFMEGNIVKNETQAKTDNRTRAKDKMFGKWKRTETWKYDECILTPFDRNIAWKKGYHQ